MNKGRKSNTSRAGGGGGNQNSRSSPRSRGPMAEGIYSNSHFLHAAAAQVGNPVRVKTKGGVIVEGIFRTFSEEFHIALEVPHRYQNADDKKINVDTVQDNLIIRASDIVSIEAKDVDLDYATRDAFATDAAISSRMNGNLRGEKVLEPWMGMEDVNGGMGVSLELDTKANGWDASEMFQKNEKDYNVKSTYNDNLEHYTVQIERKDTIDFRKQELEAERIANEIENNPKTIERLEVENGDEEAAFAAVVRNAGTSGSGEEQSNNSSSTNSNTGVNDKMSPPPASSQQQQNTQQQQKQPYIPKQQRGGSNQDQRGGRPDPNQGKMMQKQTIYTNKPMQTSAQQMQQNQPVPQTINAAVQGFKTITINPPAYNQHQPPPSHYREDPRGGNENAQQQERKINGGENSNNSNTNSSNKSSMGQPQQQQQVRPVRILNPPPIPVSFSEPPPNMPKPMSMNIPPPHLQQQPGEQGPPTTVHIVQQPVVLPPQAVVVAHPPPLGIHAAAPQPQRAPRGTSDGPMMRTRNEDIRQLRQFHNNFEMAPPLQQQQPEMPQPSVTPQNIEKPPPHVNHHITHHPTPSSTPHDHQKHGPSTTPPQANTPQQQNVNSSNNSSTGSANNSNSSEPSVASGDKSAPKKFTLNPQAKPFTPRTPSTPNQSRPHTPQTPGPMVQQQPQQQQIPPPSQQQIAYATAPSQLVYCLVPSQQRPTPPPTLTRKTQLHQFQVTGQPIFNQPVPPQVMPYHPSQMQTVQPQAYPPAIRMYSHDAQQQPHLSYLVPTPPSTTPSPGQGHQPAFHPQPSPATAGTHWEMKYSNKCPPAQTFPQTQTQYVMLMPSNGPPFVYNQHNQPFQIVSNSLPPQPPQQAQHPQQ